MKRNRGSQPISGTGSRDHVPDESLVAAVHAVKGPDGQDCLLPQNRLC